MSNKHRAAAHRNPWRRAWNGVTLVKAAAPDTSGCAHHFTIPTPDPKVEPIGTCQKCGMKRMHSNVGSGFEFGVSNWRNWSMGKDPKGDDLAYRLPPGYSLTGPVE